MLDEDPEQGIMVLRALARQTAVNLRAAEQRVAEQLESDAPDPEVEQMVANGLAAQRVFEYWDEERVDALLKDIAESDRRPRPRSWRPTSRRPTSATPPTRR